MIVTRRIGIRIALIIVLCVLLQVSFFSYLDIFGTTPDILPLVVVALGLLGGGVIGAVCGFVMGLLLDSVLLQTLGVSSLTLLTVGYLAGRYRESTEISNSLVPPLIAGALTIVAATEFAAIQLMLGVHSPVSLLVLREIFVKGMLAVILALPIYPLIRVILRPAIIDAGALGGVRSPIRAGLARRRARAPHPKGHGGLMFNERERPLLPAQFALRIAVLSGIALVMFSVIFFRLWYLQVLSGNKYVKEAENNQVREITVQAPRGQITDRNGQVLVDNRTALALQIQPTQLPRSKSKRHQEFQRLSQVAGMSVHAIETQIRKQTKELPANPVTLKRDVGHDLVYYLRENQRQYPGATVQTVYVRHYPQGDLAAHIFGYVREVTQQQLKEPRYQGLQPGDQVGQSGVENTYDNVLRGTNGMTRVQVDAEGRPTGGILSKTPPKGGDNLRLTIDDNVQRAGEAAIGSFSTPGAFIAMNVHDGEILGLGSSPTYDPSVFTHPVIPPATYRALASQTAGSPLTDRATQGLYPTGSTFKPITATAALESGVLTPTTTIVDGGTFTEGGITLHNAGGGAYGALQLPQALQVSSDVFFYNVGAMLDRSGNGAQDKWASELGIGHPTGIDIPGESGGLLPSPAWRDQLYKEHQTDRPWSEGDAVNLAIGQGDLQTDPLQMAVAYAAIANGGSVVRPHVGMEVQDPQGRAVQEINPGPERQLNINPAYTHAILDGIHMAAQSPGGTSYPVFGNFPIPMAGKTGTAQRTGQQDQSWYVALAPYPNPQIVVAATIEQGGFGVQAAAPVARQILEAYFSTHKSEAKAAGGKVPKIGSIQTGPAPTPTTGGAAGNPY